MEKPGSTASMEIEVRLSDFLATDGATLMRERMCQRFFRTLSSHLR